MLIKERLQLEQQTETDKNLTEYLFLLERNIENKSIRDMARECYTSPATIIRFCKKMGFDGWDDFKNKYIEELDYLENNFQDIDANKPFDYGDTDMMIAHKLGELYQETIVDTMKLLDHDSLQKASRFIKNSQHIYLFSLGSSLDLAQTFYEKMLKIGKSVTISRNINFQFLEAAQMNKEDCAIIISYSGETEKMIDIARLLNEKGVPFISLTSFGENRLHQLSPCTLYISTREKLISNIANYSSNISISFLLDLLFSFVFSKDYYKNIDYKIKVSHQLEKTRNSDNSILKEDE